MLSYDIYAYGKMIGDSVRTNAYAEALRRSVTPESVVLDLGTGIGIWAFLACQFGARKVYAVDTNDAIQVAREIAGANGFGDRIDFIQGFSTNITLAEKVDIIVTEMHGIVPVFAQNLPSIMDARDRLLAPNGLIIPKQETLWVAPVAAPQSHREVVKPWTDRPYEIEWGPALRVATNNWFKIKETITSAECFAEPACWTTLDYRTLASANVSGTVSWTVSQTGTAHGLAVWFDTELVEGVSFSNAPGQPQTIFSQGFFPWPTAINVSAGDKITVSLRADLVNDYYLWRWNTTVYEGEQANKIKFNFAQSNFLNLPLSVAAAQPSR